MVTQWGGQGEHAKLSHNKRQRETVVSQQKNDNILLKPQ